MSVLLSVVSIETSWLVACLCSGRILKWSLTTYCARKSTSSAAKHEESCQWAGSEVQHTRIWEVLCSLAQTATAVSCEDSPYNVYIYRKLSLGLHGESFFCKGHKHNQQWEEIKYTSSCNLQELLSMKKCGFFKLRSSQFSLKKWFLFALSWGSLPWGKCQFRKHTLEWIVIWLCNSFKIK